MREFFDNLKLYINTRLSGRITKHLFDPITLVGGLAVVVLVVLLMLLSFGGEEQEVQRKRRSGMLPAPALALPVERPTAGVSALT
jgi:hypothetical protein